MPFGWFRKREFRCPPERHHCPTARLRSWLFASGAHHGRGVRDRLDTNFTNLHELSPMSELLYKEVIRWSGDGSFCEIRAIRVKLGGISASGYGQAGSTFVAPGPGPARGAARPG